MTLIIVTGEIDLSVASVVGPEQRPARHARRRTALSVPVAGARRLVVGLACGAFNGFLVAYVGLPSLAVTIGTLALYRGIAVGVLGTKAVTDFPNRWTDLARQTDRRHRHPADRGPVRRARGRVHLAAALLARSAAVSTRSA